MKKILIITDRFFPTKNANTIISNNIIIELIARGYEIHCISINQNIPTPQNSNIDFAIYPVQSTSFAKINQEYRLNRNIKNRMKLMGVKGLRSINNLIHFYRYPAVDYSQTENVIHLATDIIEQEGIDVIIGFFRPYSAVEASIKLKQTFSKLKCVIVFLDLLSGGNKPNGLPLRFFNKKNLYSELKILGIVDTLLVHEDTCKHFSSDVFSKYQEKLEFMKYPVFIESNINSCDIRNDDSVINLVFAGTLSSQYRSPSSMLESLSTIAKKGMSIRLHLIGKNNCQKIIDSFKEIENFNILEYGELTHEDTISIMQQADFLINISNNIANMVPSKIFELFSIAKPIINFNTLNNDPILPFIDYYPNILCLKTKPTIDELELLKQFLYDKKNVYIDLEMFNDFVIEYTPKFFVDKLENHIL